MARLHRSPMRRLIDEIVSGELPEDEWLPREVDLAERFHVSRGVVRETLRALEERGLIHVRHGRGARVLPDRSWNVLDPDVLEALLERGDAAALLAEVLECRRLLEAQAAAAAAERATRRDVRALSDAYARLEAAAAARRARSAEDDPFVAAEAAFHRELVALAGNRPLSRMIEPLHAGIAAAGHALLQGREQALLAQYDRIVAAIADQDPRGAREAVEAHVAELAASLRGPAAGRRRLPA